VDSTSKVRDLRDLVRDLSERPQAARVLTLRDLETSEAKLNPTKFTFTPLKEEVSQVSQVSQFLIYQGDFSERPQKRSLTRSLTCGDAS